MTQLVGGVDFSGIFSPAAHCLEVGEQDEPNHGALTDVLRIDIPGVARVALMDDY